MAYEHPAVIWLQPRMPTDLVHTGIGLGTALIVVGAAFLGATLFPTSFQHIGPTALITVSLIGLAEAGLWYSWQENTEPPELFIEWHIAFMPSSMPPEGWFNFLDVSREELSKGGDVAPYGRHGGKPSSDIHWPRFHPTYTPQGYLLKLTNYTDAPLLEVDMPLRISFRENASGQSGATVLDRERHLRVEKLDPGPSNAFAIYLLNYGREFVTITPPAQGSAYRFGEDKSFPVKLKAPVNLLGRLPMVFSPFVPLPSESKQP